MEEPKTKFIYLASASPRRCELLGQLGMNFEQVPADIDETPRQGEAPRDYVVRMALEKAHAASRRLDGEHVPVLGADTSVVIDGDILGKPEDQQHAAEMLRRLSDNVHKVMSGVAVVGGGREASEVSVTEVKFRQLSDAEIAGYWATGEPQDKAGGYAIQGVAAAFIEQIRGSYSGVMGLPLFETSRLLELFGYALLKRVVH